MDEERTNTAPTETSSLSNLASTLLSDPDLMNRIRALMQGVPSAEASAPTAEASAPASAPLASLPSGGNSDGLSTLLSNPAIMEKLPQIMAMLGPMLSSTAAQPTVASVQESHPSRGIHSDRDKLLLSLKPFLSHERQEAVDAILRIAKLGTILQQIK